MQYIIGIDGGGTKTQCAIADINGEIIYECTGGASNFISIGTEKVSQTILNLIDDCRKELNINFSDIQIVVLGTTGAGRRVDAERMEKAFNDYAANKNITFDHFHVESDARIALEGAFSGKPGCILISGTGSIIFAKSPDGKIHRAGGFGKLIGDEGSGFAIGRKGLAAASKQLDERGVHTQIAKLIREKFSIDSPEKLITEVYRNNLDIASAAPLVLDAAEQGDSAALKIIDEESDELLLHISAMVKNFKTGEINIAFIGSLISTENIFSRTLKKKIIMRYPEVKVRKPEHPPAAGAIIIGKTFLNKN